MNKYERYLIKKNWKKIKKYIKKEFPCESIVRKPDSEYEILLGEIDIKPYYTPLTGAKLIIRVDKGALHINEIRYKDEFYNEHDVFFGTMQMRKETELAIKEYVIRNWADIRQKIQKFLTADTVPKDEYMENFDPYK